MKRIVWLMLLGALALWITFGWLVRTPPDHPVGIFVFGALERPTSIAELGDAFGILAAVLSPIALILALATMLTQAKLQTNANVIGGFAARQQFLLAECDRLEDLIQELKARKPFDQGFFDNSVAKKQRYYREVNEIDERLKALLNGL